jgi:hypothetical protein
MMPLENSSMITRHESGQTMESHFDESEHFAQGQLKEIKLAFVPIVNKGKHLFLNSDYDHTARLLALVVYNENPNDRCWSNSIEQFHSGSFMSEPRPSYRTMTECAQDRRKGNWDVDDTNF